MAVSYSGTVLSAPIVVGTDLDNFPTHKSEFGKGGWHEVATTQDRDAIPAERRTEGMAVYVVEEHKFYILEGDLSTWEDSTETYQPAIEDLSSIRSGAAAGATALQPNTAIIGATKCKITYDSNGLVTAGGDLTANDIPEITLSKITDVTATAAELNYTAGLTGDIQSQLNNKVAKNDDITAGTHTKITYDAKGLVTAGADLAASDIPNLSLSKITDVTATAAELNILHGATLDTTELNYVDGVTSSIQGQIGTLSSLTTDAKGSLQAAINEVDSHADTNASDISDIQALIPSQATSSNQLADKDFVNNAVSSNTGNFIGTFNSTADRDAYSGTVGNNDYCFVIEQDGTGNTRYDRYKWTVAPAPAAWVFEYSLNNSSFSSDQWAAINSGATTTNIGQITTNQNAIGTLSSLTTTAKTNLVSAINELDSSKLDANAAIVGATKCKITYDSNGLVTAGADLAASDIPDLSATYQTVLVSGTSIKTINNTSILGSGNIDTHELPSQSGNSGKFLTTNGTAVSWSNIDALPAQSGHNGEYLKTNGTTASWDVIDTLPSQTGHNGHFLKTNGALASWAAITIPTKISNLTDDTATNPVDKADTLTGLTSTVAELNYVDGVTSNIQTQLNNKQGVLTEGTGIDITNDVVSLDAILNNLKDVVISSLSNNDLLRYNSANGKWVNIQFTEIDGGHANSSPTPPTPSDVDGGDSSIEPTGSIDNGDSSTSAFDDVLDGGDSTDAPIPPSPDSPDGGDSSTEPSETITNGDSSTTLFDEVLDGGNS